MPVLLVLCLRSEVASKEERGTRHGVQVLVSMGRWRTKEKDAPEMITRRRKKRPDPEYIDFLANTDWPCCWACGRTGERRHKPSWWNAPWMLHRAHIASKPRVESALAVVLLCPACHHGHFHGERYAAELDAPALTAANLLWLKSAFDPARFDREFLQRHSVQILPEPEPLPAWYDQQWAMFQKVPRPQPC